MYILDMLDKVEVVSDLMFPIAMLPNCLFAAVLVTDRLATLELNAVMSAEITFDLPPTG